ncbi:hypothetical protein NDU88_003632 [Pleurodeles waltl]|uniref:Uncharacterized protein n=1 Tax=Pleurodeles waltl TaxID=8319 RepID=A0AAV7M7L7_PLEWA|nr:hypothetical protein NDU88_003632 [Pleurodeles waltl]
MVSDGTCRTGLSLRGDGAPTEPELTAACPLGAALRSWGRWLRSRRPSKAVSTAATLHQPQGHICGFRDV